MTTVFLVAEVRAYRDALADRLDRSESVRVVGTASDGPSAVSVIKQLSPDVVLVDTAEREGLASVGSIAAAAPNSRVVALAVQETEGAIAACARAGVDGLVSREGRIDDIAAAIEGVLKGELPCSPRMAALLLAHATHLACGRRQTSQDVDSRLTAREIDILGLLQEGSSNKEIAAHLGIELATVKNHVHNVLDKLGVMGRAEAAAWARTEGIASSRD